MENPEKDIHEVLEGLCKGNIQEQTATVTKYFLPDAAFEHPYCRVPSFSDTSLLGLSTLNSRWVILMIYRLYRMLSPNIEFHVKSCVFDKANRILYLNLWQTFSVWFIPFYSARVHLVSVLTLQAVSKRSLVTGSSGTSLASYSNRSASSKGCLYFVKRQQDYYQLNDILKFISLWAGSSGSAALQLFSSLVCALVASLCAPLYFLLWPNWRGARAAR